MKRRAFLRAGAAAALAAPGRRGPRHRPVRAGDQMAPDLQLSQVARHDLRRRADAVPLRRRGDRQQVPDPAVRRRRAGAQPAGPRRRHQRLRSSAPTRRPTSTSARTRRSASAPACRSASTAATSSRGGPSPAAPTSSTPRSRSSTPTASRPATPARKWAAGSSKEIDSVDDLKGLQLPHQRHGRPGAGTARRGAAADRRTPTSIAALERGTIDAAEFICPHDDEKLGLAKVAKYNYYPCWWESSGMLHLVVNLESGTRCRSPTRRSLARACDAANTWMLAKYDAVNAAGAQAPDRRRRRPQAVPAAGDGGLLQGHQRALRRARRPRTPHFKKALELGQCLPQGAAALVADRRPRLRQLHASARAAAHESARFTWRR